MSRRDVIRVSALLVGGEVALCLSGRHDDGLLLGRGVDDRYAWHRANTGDTGTRPAARKRPNDLRLYDMVGNAWEYCRQGDACFAMRGGARTRCSKYRTHHGTFTGDLPAESVEPRLHECNPNPTYPPYPWDDDRSFRCIRRVSPEAK